MPVTGERQEEGIDRQQRLIVTNGTYSILEYENLPAELRGTEREGRGASEEGAGIQGEGGGTAGGGRAGEGREGSEITLAASESLEGESEIRKHCAINARNEKLKRVKRRREQQFVNAAVVQLQEIFRPNQQNILLEAPELSDSNTQINPLQLIMPCHDYNC